MNAVINDNRSWWILDLLVKEKAPQEIKQYQAKFTILVT